MQKRVKMQKSADTVKAALGRMVKQSMEHGGGEVYLCTLRLPKQLADSPAKSNDIFRKVQSDLYKYAMRHTGQTPRYVAVRTIEEDCPAYNVCVFANNDATIKDAEAFVDKAQTIANSKTVKGGWDTSQMDIVQILQNAAQFRLSNTLPVSNESLVPMQEHLADISKNDRNTTYMRNIFVSRCL